MLLTNPFLTLSWALALGSVSAATPPPNLALDVRNAPGSSTEDTLLALRRSLAGIKRDTILKNSTTLDKSWNGATLLSIAASDSTKSGVSVSAAVDITCTTCYIKGNATAQFSVDGKFNASQALSNFTSEVKTEVLNTTEQVIDSIEDYFPTVIHNLADGFDLDDFDFPPINTTFDIDLPDIPECHLQFQFDDLEMYFLIDTVLSAGATYNLNLFSSNTPIGISAGNDLFLGVVFSVDLILSVNAEIDVSSGFHIKLDDGVGLDMSLFGRNVSNIIFNGAEFEFLPVTIEGAGGLMKAVLRLGVKAGFELETPGVTIPSFSFSTKASAGVGVSVWADIAEFATNVTAAPAGDEDGCALKMEQTYQFALGAAAGATLAIGAETWGPSPNTNIPIFYTTIANVCAIGKTTTTTTTVSTPAATFTGIACLTTGLVNCPASLQTTTKVTSTLTYITSVASGVEVTFPASTGTGVATPVAFGTNRKSVDATSGSPVSYTPPPPTASPSSGDSTVSAEHPLGEVGGVDKRIIIGVCVGLGVPVLIGIAVGIFVCQKRRRYASVPKGDPVYLGQPQPYESSRESKNRIVTSH
ncbi:hypothetical protein F5B19DRAFT_486056 [Rostrohypoxylon terebratum]|nr:hypothetical protein F5B19DRAFT_486056 [Rostrohypoxylon terebratum]